MVKYTAPIRNPIPVQTRKASQPTQAYSLKVRAPIADPADGDSFYRQPIQPLGSSSSGRVGLCQWQCQYNSVLAALNAPTKVPSGDILPVASPVTSVSRPIFINPPTMTY
jgi:hypothetical protein